METLVDASWPDLFGGDDLAAARPRLFNQGNARSSGMVPAPRRRTRISSPRRAAWAGPGRPRTGGMPKVGPCPVGRSRGRRASTWAARAGWLAPIPPERLNPLGWNMVVRVRDVETRATAVGGDHARHRHRDRVDRSGEAVAKPWIEACEIDVGLGRRPGRLHQPAVQGHPGLDPRAAGIDGDLAHAGTSFRAGRPHPISSENR